MTVKRSLVDFSAIPDWTDRAREVVRLKRATDPYYDQRFQFGASLIPPEIGVASLDAGIVQVTQVVR